MEPNYYSINSRLRTCASLSYLSLGPGSGNRVKDGIILSPAHVLTSKPRNSRNHFFLLSLSSRNLYDLGPGRKIFFTIYDKHIEKENKEDIDKELVLLL